MAHEMLQGGQADAGARHIRPEGMAKAMGIGEGSAAGQTMMAEQRPEARHGHRPTAKAAFQTDEQTAAVEVHDGALPAEREDHPATERVATLGGDEAAFEQLIEAIAVVRQVAAQNTTGCVANAEFLNEGGIAQSTFLEILHGFRMAVELELVKGGGLFQHVGIDRRRELLLEIGDALAEGQIPGQLDQADQVAATAATVASRTDSCRH